MQSSGRPDPPPGVGGPTLAQVLGSRGGVLDASIPPVAFAVGYAIAGGADNPVALRWGAGAALVAGLVIAVVRLAHGRRPTAALAGLLGVAAAVLLVLYTGRAVDLFLLRIAANAASALVWVVSIVVRWPLLGLVVGTALGQRARWRRDPDLLRGYGRASWVWAGQYVLRVAVFVPLYLGGSFYLLTAAQGLLSYPLLVVCVVASWPLLRGALPAGHPGLLHPRVPDPDGGSPYSGPRHEE